MYGLKVKWHLVAFLKTKHMTASLISILTVEKVKGVRPEAQHPDSLYQSLPPVFCKNKIVVIILQYT